MYTFYRRYGGKRGRKARLLPVGFLSVSLSLSFFLLSFLSYIKRVSALWKSGTREPPPPLELEI